MFPRVLNAKHCSDVPKEVYDQVFYLSIILFLFFLTFVPHACPFGKKKSSRYLQKNVAAAAHVESATILRRLSSQAPLPRDLPFRGHIPRVRIPGVYPQQPIGSGPFPGPTTCLLTLTRRSLPRPQAPLHAYVIDAATKAPPNPGGSNPRRSPPTPGGSNPRRSPQTPEGAIQDAPPQQINHFQ